MIYFAKRFLIVLLSFFLFEAQATQKIPLKEVDLYLQGAKLIHKGAVDLKGGSQKIQIQGLASNMDEQSLQLSFPKEVQLLKFQVVKQPLRAAPRPSALLPLLDSMQLLQYNLSLHRANAEVFAQEQQLILANKQLGGQNGVNVMELQKMSDFFRVRLQELNLKLAHSKSEEVKLLEQIAGVKARLERERSLLPEFEVVLELDLNAFKAGNHLVTISYLVDAAYWEPTYEIRSKGMGAPIELFTKAQITQNTGLDWKEVRLSISTQLPQQISAKPMMNPWVLDFYEPRPVRVYGRIDAEQAASAPRMNADLMESSAKLGSSPNFIAKQQLLSITYEPQQRFTIPNALSQLVPLNEHQFEAEYNHFVAPRLSKEVYLIASLTGIDSVRLMPGKATVYFENTLINQAWMEFASENDTLELPLGIDKLVKVTFKETIQMETKRIAQQHVKHFSYSIDVFNGHSRQIALKVEDQLPISRQKEIVVDDLQLNNAERDEATGLLRWSSKFEAGTTNQITYSFKVRHPKNKKVVNL